jgi:hypothetical protein
MFTKLIIHPPAPVNSLVMPTSRQQAYNRDLVRSNPIRLHLIKKPQGIIPQTTCAKAEIMEVQDTTSLSCLSPKTFLAFSALLNTT